MKSSHVFMFPFLIRTSEEDELPKLDLKKIHECIVKDYDFETDTYTEPMWQFDNGKYDENGKLKDYNLNAYFYANVVNSIYGDLDKNNQFIPNTAVLNYSYKKENLEYHIKIKKDNKVPKTYILNILQLELRIATTEVGILTMVAEYNAEDIQLEDINCINEYGRRIYPQFIANSDSKYLDRVSVTKGTFLADALEIRETIDGISTVVVEEKFDDSKALEDIRLSETVLGILGPQFTNYEHKERDSGNKLMIQPVIDDRMFVLCHMMSDDAMKDLLKSEDDNENVDEEPLFLKDMNKMEELYKFIFIENSLTCPYSKMMKESIEKHTYLRWLDKNITESSIYGMTHYSFMLLSGVGGYPEVILNNHMLTLYKEMVQLVLLQRASLLKFEDDISRFTEKYDGQKYKENILKIEAIYEKYLNYKNLIYYREVTAQEQGIELYGKLMDIMNIHANTKDLQDDIKELQEMSALQESKRTTSTLNFLTYLAGIFMIPTFITGLYGMNIGYNDLTNVPILLEVAPISFSIILSAVAIFIHNKPGKLSRKVVVILFILAMLSPLIGYMIEDIF